MEEKLNGIVTGGVNYGENDRVLSIFTAEKGIVGAGIKGVKKAGAKLKFASEPFCFAEFVFSTKCGRRTVIGASLIDSFYPLREDITKYFCGVTVLEYLRKFFKEEISSPQTFVLAVEALKELSYGKKSPKTVLASFLLSALSVSGYGINSTFCAECGKDISGRTFFDHESGGFYCEKCNEKGREIKPETLLAIRKIKDGEDISEKMQTAALRLIDYYIRNKTEESVNSLAELLKL